MLSRIKGGFLVEFLSSHRAEVLDVCITEFDEKTFVDGIREEGRIEGREEGMEKMQSDLVSRMLKNGKCEFPEGLTHG